MLGDGLLEGAFFRDFMDEGRTAVTKIVATVGPSSRSGEVMQKMVHGGLRIMRLNTSHATKEVRSCGAALWCVPLISWTLLALGNGNARILSSPSQCCAPVTVCTITASIQASTCALLSWVCVGGLWV